MQREYGNSRVYTYLPTTLQHLVVGVGATPDVFVVSDRPHIEQCCEKTKWEALGKTR